MPRYRLTLEYDGSPFVGWQRQDNGLSVQAAVEEAARRFVGVDVDVTGAGRTDAGVHALGQVAHVDLPAAFPTNTVRDAINFYLRPAPISVLAVSTADGDFHARFSARRRRYRYRIINRRPPLTLERNRAWWVPYSLNAKHMADAASLLVGHYDFSSFRSSACQAASPMKTLDRLQVRREGDEIIIEAEARSFLHNQVRIMVGSLRLVGDGRWSIQQMVAARAACSRQAAGPTAPAAGLYLVAVEYP